MNDQQLKCLVQHLLANDRVSRILIRPHPKNLWRQLDASIASHGEGKVFRSSGSTVDEDIRDLHFVIGGNSSVLIDAVTAGVAGAYVDNLDYGSTDLHGFVAGGLVPQSTVEPDFDEIFRFYQNPEWQTVLRRFANIDTDESTVPTDALQVIANLRTKQRIAT